MSGSRRFEILQVDAFTTRPFSGNPAGVVLDPGDLSAEEMQSIAREMNLSETAFLLPPADPSADVQIRWFTPAVEVDLCGHATIATFHAALEAGTLKPGTYRMECRSGLLRIELEEISGRARVQMELPVPEIGPCPVPPEDLARMLGIGEEAFSRTLEIRRAGEWILIPVEDLKTLKSLYPDFPALSRLGLTQGLGNTIVLSRQTTDPGSHVQIRMFAPAYGIDEDPVTGSAQGPVAAYLADQRQLDEPDANGVCRYRAEQGDAIRRPGRIDVALSLRAGRPESITIAGSAVTVVRGILILDS